MAPRLEFTEEQIPLKGELMNSDRSEENIQNEVQRNKRLEILKIVKDPEKIQRKVVYVPPKFQEKEKKSGAEEIFEEVMPEKFSKTDERHQAIVSRSITPQTS